jgi:hypothetical protein
MQGSCGVTRDRQNADVGAPDMCSQCQGRGTPGCCWAPLKPGLSPEHIIPAWLWMAGLVHLCFFGCRQSASPSGAKTMVLFLLGVDARHRGALLADRTRTMDGSARSARRHHDRIGSLSRGHRCGHRRRPPGGDYPRGRSSRWSGPVRRMLCGCTPASLAVSPTSAERRMAHRRLPRSGRGQSPRKLTSRGSKPPGERPRVASPTFAPRNLRGGPSTLGRHADGDAPSHSSDTGVERGDGRASSGTAPERC